jgi:uncharacterized protein
LTREIVLEEDQFTLMEDGHEVGKITFVPNDPSTLIVDYIFLEERLRGQGLAEELVKRIVDHARESGMMIVPTCPYVYAQFRRNASYHDVWKR